MIIFIYLKGPVVYLGAYAEQNIIVSNGRHRYHFTALEHRRNIYKILTCLDVLLFDFGHLSRQKPMPVLIVAQL